MKRAVIYARYSSERQTEQSIEGQVRACKEYAKSHNIIILNSYIDRATTGTNDNRQAFQSMLKDSKKKEWDTVLVYKLDRFSRNKYEMAIHRHELKNNGVTIISAKENIPEGPEGILLESLLEGMNQYYSEELAQKVKRGIRETRIKGKYLGGTPPYGYDAPTRFLVINEEEAKIIQYIFNEYLRATQTSKIAESLNENGLTYRGSKFTRDSVYKILKRECYTGVIKCDDEEYTNIYPQIITPEIFKSAQKILKRNSVGKHKENVVYLLRDKVYCGICNRKFISHAGSSNRNLRRYYRCASNQNKKNCGATTIRKEVLEEFINKIILRIFKDSNLYLLIEKIYEIHKKRQEGNSVLRMLKKDLVSTKKSINNIVNAIEKGIFSKTTLQRLQELEAKEKELTEKILEVENTEIHDLTKEEIEQYLKYTLTQPPQILIDLLIKKVVYYNDKLDIILNYVKNNYNKETKLISSFVESVSYLVNIGRGRTINKIVDRTINIYV